MEKEGDKDLERQPKKLKRKMEIVIVWIENPSSMAMSNKMKPNNKKNRGK